MKRLLSVGVLGAVVLGFTVPRTVGLAQRPAKTASPHLWHVNIGVDFFYGGLNINAFFPSNFTIRQGDSVQFTNQSPLRPQTVTFGPILATPPLITRADFTEINPRVVKPQGGKLVGDTTINVYSSGALMGSIPGLPTKFTFTFPNPGTYLYRSLFHPQSLAQIVVVGPNQPVSPDPPDSGQGYREVLRSADKAINTARSGQRNNGVSFGGPSIEIGGGDGNVSLNTMSPEGVTIKVGAKVTWVVRETSGDPHAIVINPVSISQGTPYTSLAPDGGLAIDPRIAKPSLMSDTTVVTDTVKPNSSSGIIYGSSVDAPSTPPTSYTLTFGIPGGYIIYDPFGGARGLPQINVIP